MIGEIFLQNHRAKNEKNPDDFSEIRRARENPEDSES